MIKRKIYKKIQEWKETTNGSRALLIEGEINRCNRNR